MSESFGVASLENKDTWRIIEEELEKPSIFKSRESLSPEYIPDQLPHREKELRELTSYFKHLVTTPGSISQRVLITGRVGTGKTALAKVFGRDFTRLAGEKNYKVKYAHVNCHRNRTLYNVIADIGRQLDVPVPSRGLSSKEMYDLILNYLDERDEYAIITLDEFHYFANISGPDAVYFIVRTYDAEELFRRLNFIFIAIDPVKLGFLDPTTEGYLLRHLVKLNPYTSQQLFDILKYRAEESMYEGSYDDEVLRFIADFEGWDKGGGGNARHALEILHVAGSSAEADGRSRITIEDVRKAIMNTSREILSVSEAIRDSPIHELLILLSIVKLLRKTGRSELKIGEVEEEYNAVCEFYGEVPRRHTQVYEYVMNLSRTGIIQTRSSGKGQRGRSTMITLPYGPLDVLEKYLDELIRKKIQLGL
jgi:cell division control protein 6